MTWSDTLRMQVDEDLTLIRALIAADRPVQLQAAVDHLAGVAHAVLDTYDAATAPPVPRSGPNLCQKCRHNRWHDEVRGCLDFNPPDTPVPASTRCGCKARSDGRVR